MASLDKGAASARVDSEPSESQSRTLAHDATLKIAQSVSLMLGSDSLDIVGMCGCLEGERKFGVLTGTGC